MMSGGQYGIEMQEALKARHVASKSRNRGKTALFGAPRTKANEFCKYLRNLKLTNRATCPKPRSPLGSTTPKANAKANKPFRINANWVCAIFTQSQEVI
jgi:hypothetical protein